MKIKTIRIQNFRQFKDCTINFDENITMLAGANNSGKTSLIELLKDIFNNATCTSCIENIPIKMITDWVDAIYPKVKEKCQTGLSREEKIKEIVEFVSSDKDCRTIAGTEVDIEVIYSKKESITKFADYLMDLDETKFSFYFKFRFELSVSKFHSGVEIHLDKLVDRFNTLKNAEGDDRNIAPHIKNILMNLYVRAMEDKYYFTDSTYKNTVPMEGKKFKALFNLNYLFANRSVDDVSSDSNYSISKGVINYISKDDEWETLIDGLPDKIMQPIEQKGFKDKIKKKSLDGLNQIIEVISKTNGARKEEIALDMDINEESIKRLLNDITSAEYIIESYSFKERTQGLGYNNLIYMHLKLEDYIKQVDSSIVNIFIIEEPESHMHPQMQRIFIKHLFEYYEGKGIQGLITTHSNHIVRVTNIKKLRVIRKIETFKNCIYDMSVFIAKIEDIELRDFYNLFFSINYSDIVFADKIIMFEGDTERMFVEKVLELERFEILRNQYIAYVQVGGAYAHWYKNIVNFLGIKTLIITDIDYRKACSNKKEVLESETTNGAIKSFYIDDNAVTGLSLEKLNIRSIFSWGKGIWQLKQQSQCRLVFQTDNDGFSRTLEEAMLCKLFGITCFDDKEKAWWKEKRKETKLKFSIPKKDAEYNIRRIVRSTADAKTDFMYSVLINGLTEKMLPRYIEEGLKWLVD